MVYLEIWIEGHVFDLDFVVDRKSFVGHTERSCLLCTGEFKYDTSIVKKSTKRSIVLHHLKTFSGSDHVTAGIQITAKVTTPQLTLVFYFPIAGLEAWHCTGCSS